MADENEAIGGIDMSNPEKKGRRRQQQSGGAGRGGGGKRARAGGRNGEEQESLGDYGSTSGLIRRGKRVAETASDWVEGARESMQDVGRYLPSQRTLEPLTSNPVVLGAVGLGLGIVIGALLPRDTVRAGMQSVGLSSTGGGEQNRTASRRRSGKSGGRRS